MIPGDAGIGKQAERTMVSVSGWARLTAAHFRDIVYPLPLDGGDVVTTWLEYGSDIEPMPMALAFTLTAWAKERVVAFVLALFRTDSRISGHRVGSGHSGVEEYRRMKELQATTLVYAYISKLMQVVKAPKPKR